MEEEYQKYTKMIEDVIDYVDLAMDRSCLDGWYSSSELRKIAEAMDTWKLDSVNNKAMQNQ